MKVITKDVRTTIPNFMESDYNSSLFIVELLTKPDISCNNIYSDEVFFGIINRRECNSWDTYQYIYTVDGFSFIQNLLEYITWITGGHSLLEIITGIWHHYSRAYYIKITILENLSDILQWTKLRTEQLGIEEGSWEVISCLNSKYANLPSHHPTV